MKNIILHTPDGNSEIMIGERLGNLGKYIQPQRTIIVTDTNLAKLYEQELAGFEVIKIKPGEEHKNLQTVEEIYKQLVKLEVDRSHQLVAVGGGVVSDIAGFAASTYLRGISFGFVSSTLLAQVDASVGGKNGVNLLGYKNLIGVFSQPRFVLCDLQLLKTLPPRELHTGLAEALKCGLLGKPKLFDFMDRNYERALSLDEKTLEQIVYESISLKAEIVERDEREKDERRKLNLGHTLGHAIEKVKRLSHGEAISLGMIFAAKVSLKEKLISIADYQRLESLLGKLKLPVELQLDKELIKDAIRKDKKRSGEDINFVLLEGLGKSRIKRMPLSELEGLVDDLC